MNIVDSILAQSAAGSANGQGFGGDFARGVQMRQQNRQLDQSQQRIDIEQLQEQAKQTLLPTQQALLQQKVQMGKLQIDQTLQDRQDKIDNTAAFGELSGTVGDLLGDDNPLGAAQVASQAIARKPALADDPRVLNLWKNIHTSVQFGHLAATTDIAKQRAATAQQNADTHATDITSKVDTREAGLDLKERDLGRKEGADAERKRHNLETEATTKADQQRKWMLVGQFANHSDERDVGHAVAAEIKMIAEDTDPEKTFAKKHALIEGVLARAQREHPNAYTSKDRAHLSDLMQNATPVPVPIEPGAASPVTPAAGAWSIQPDGTYGPSQ